MVIKMSPISKTYKSFTAPDFAFSFPSSSVLQNQEI